MLVVVTGLWWGILSGFVVEEEEVGEDVEEEEGEEEEEEELGVESEVEEEEYFKTMVRCWEESVL